MSPYKRPQRLADSCGTDCRALLKEASKSLPHEVQSWMWDRRLMQTCDQCQWQEPAGGMCSQCGHFPLPSEWQKGGLPLSGMFPSLSHSQDGS